MKLGRKSAVCGIAVGITAALVSGCGGKNSASETRTEQETAAETAQASEAAALRFDSSNWNYNEEDQVYWKVGVQYCEKPASLTYETLGIYVPAAYLNGEENGDGTYTCTVKEDAEVNGYTAANAPIVMPINTPGYAAQLAPAEYTSGLASYLDQGFIYVIAGCRGRQSMGGGPGGPGGGMRPGEGAPDEKASDEKPEETRTEAASEAEKETVTGSAPWGVVDLKAAIRYLRYNAAALPGDTDRIFTFGMSGGGAQSALVGVTGDSALYTPYLEAIGAAMTDADGNALSDAVEGSMCWCPITSLDYADEAYEWSMGQFVSTDTRADGTFTKELSNDLAKAYAEYINGLGLTSEDGTALTLEESEDGIDTSGTYYAYLIKELEVSLNHFLSDTAFPYTPDNSMQAGFAGNAGGDNGASQESTETVSYATPEDYIASLNAEEAWIAYDAQTNTASITSMAGFVRNCKKPTKAVGAFDALDRSQGENQVFGDDDNNALHFDPIMAKLLADHADRYSSDANWDASYPEAYRQDLAYTNHLGSTMAERVNMYNPMYYLSPAYEGYGTSKVAPNIRIRVGLFQGDTAMTVETNLALLLSQTEGVNVDFESVWGLYHTTAERSGSATDNFVQWVVECTAE